MARNRNRPTRSRRLDAREQKTTRRPKYFGAYLVAVVCFSVLVVTVTVVSVLQLARPTDSQRPRRTSSDKASPEPAPTQEPRGFQFGKLGLLWDSMPPDVRMRLKPTSVFSNIMPQDHVGPDACSECHKKNYAQWSQHPHRWMNAVANDKTVKGDFSGASQMEYLGGVATFFRSGSEFRMRFQRDDLEREYLITQTIGSRFHQYYVGIGVVGPEPQEHDYYHVDFVLPFGYWLDRKAWVPVVHIFEEKPEGERWESVELLKPSGSSQEVDEVGTSRGVFDHSQQLGVAYARSCNFCHTTFALGDKMVRNPKRVGPSMVENTLLEMSDYVSAVHPELWSGVHAPEVLPSEGLEALIDNFVAFDAREHAVTLGVSCEACHLGCRQHAENENSKPAFIGQNPNLLVFRDSTNDTGRTPENVNATCGRCHAGKRPTYAGGMSTWNSTEHTDALRGSCYSQLSCINCHNPHESIGKAWQRTPQQDDATCLECHPRFSQPEMRSAHTHHPAGSEGDRCLNCHMPKINEGMQDVVRTHAIFSPTQPDMIEANQPNACNICHLDQSIDWTTNYLQQWYGKTFDEAKITQSYIDRSEPVGIGWLKQSHEPTRLVATEAFGEQAARWGLSQVIEQLDDPYLLNRQFAQKAVESLSGVLLDQKFGYWYYMNRKQREPLITKIRDELGNGNR